MAGRIREGIVWSLFLLAFASLYTGCSKGKGAGASDTDSLPSDTTLSATSRFHKGDTIRVGTLYSPTTYFLYRETPMGYAYDLASDYARERGLVMKLEVVHSLSRLMEMLEKDSVDLVAADIPVTKDFKERVTHCGPIGENHQLLVQMKSDSMVTDVTQLPGREIVVEKDSRYESRLDNLNSELGGGIKINAIQQDTLIEEDLLKMVAEGKADFTIIDSEKARLNAPYYPQLDMSMAISLDQRTGWGVRHSDAPLAADIDEWLSSSAGGILDKALHKKYYEESVRGYDPGKKGQKILGKGRISLYDNFFRHHSKIAGWDWRLVAAVGYTESGFDPNVKSWAGAKGIMQLMPQTGRLYGLDGNSITDPEGNIRAGASLIRDMDKTFRQRGVTDKTERIRFVLAAYNSGPAHIYDAMALAKKYGRDPTRWYGNVRDCVMWKSKPQYYNDPVVKYGYFNGKQTVNFVDNVLDTYEVYKSKIN